MQLKKIILQGFKSFADKTTLEFKSGITAVVGPNGSGKSNLADAVRWVLGEQSNKLLRSKLSEDVIFSGSKNKSRLSKAGVFLFLDNRDQRIPLDFKEVSIGRKFYRNGENDYLINNSRVRLLDLKEILVQAGFGQRTYSVINQGMADHIVNSAPQSRRELFEEAAKIKPYQFKRNKSQNKLQKAKENLQLVSNILQELRPHLHFLKRQMKKIEKRKQAEQKLKNLKREFFQLKFASLSKNLNEKIENEKNLKKEYQEKNTLVQDTQKETQDTQQKYQECTQGIQNIFSAINSLYSKKNKEEEELAIMQGTLKAKKLESQILQKMLIKERLVFLEKEKKEKIVLIQNLVQEETNATEKIEAIIKNMQTEKMPLNIKIDKILQKIKNLRVLVKSSLKSPTLIIQKKIKKIFESLEINIKNLNSSENNHVVTLFELKAKLKNVQEQKTKQILELKIIKEKLAKLNQEIKQNIEKKNIKTDQSEIESSMQALEETKKEIQILEKEKIQKEQEENKLKTKFFEQERTARRLEDEIKNFQIKHGEIIRTIENLKQERAFLKIKAKKETELRLNYNHIIANPNIIEKPIEKTKSKMEKLQNIFLSLPVVDQETINEFNENEKKYNFLLSQKEDLEKALVSLKDIIKKLNKIIQKKFNQSFFAINKEFKKHFRMLFGGGTAGLTLENIKDENIKKKNSTLQNSGIKIKAVPPGKKLKNTNMLSGGEKALTSLALLFAIFQINPTPFCILDEVDAALDESNSIRFANILKKLSKKTQFLTITHNRETMRQANCLYGVTMDKGGVSKIISLSLTKAEVYANDK